MLQLVRPPSAVGAALAAAAHLGPLWPAPADLDAAAFGPAGALAALALALPFGVGGVSLLPHGSGLGTAPAAAAPVHVLALLAGGAHDGGGGLASPAWAGAGAVALGGLWSRRLGPHRAIWSWDAVEVAAVDLFAADTAADHAWGQGRALRGAAWGGGAVRLFRLGLAASHHHLSGAGGTPPAPSWGLVLARPAPALWALGACWLGSLPPCPPLRGRRSPAPSAPGPWAASESSLAAWALAVWAPTGGALAAWGLWMAPLYAWAALGALGAATGLPQAAGKGSRGAHAPLVPMSHAMGGGLLWAPGAPGPRWGPMPNQIVCFRTWYRLQAQCYDVAGSAWMASRPSRPVVRALIKFAGNIFVPYFRPTSVFGFSLLVNMVTQMLSGILLSLYYVPDPSFVVTFREEYMNEVWWYYYVYKMHVVGVDTIFVLSYLHIFKKIYIKNYLEGDLDGWFTGAYAFLVYHIVVFLGITLSTNHLGDVTITIAANIFWSLLGRAHKAYAPLFTNKHLNVDQLVRFMIAHYVCAWYYTYLIQLHVMFIHEAWDADSNLSAPQDGQTPKLSWLWDSLKKEALSMFSLYVVLMTWFIGLSYPDSHVVNYTFFEQWSETEVEEINFFLVAPHWYFRPHMGLLTICAAHYEGLAWLVAFYLLLNLMPHLSRLFQANKAAVVRADAGFTRGSLAQQGAFVVLAASVLYAGGTLPCGRFYYEAVEGFFGNSVLKLSYQYVYLYMGALVHALDALERWSNSLSANKRGLVGLAGSGTR